MREVQGSSERPDLDPGLPSIRSLRGPRSLADAFLAFAWMDNYLDGMYNTPNRPFPYLAGYEVNVPSEPEELEPEAPWGHCPHIFLEPNWWEIQVASCPVDHRPSNLEAIPTELLADEAQAAA